VVATTCHHCENETEHWVLYSVYSHAQGRVVTVRLCLSCVLDHKHPGHLAERYVKGLDVAQGVDVAERWYRAA